MLSQNKNGLACAVFGLVAVVVVAIPPLKAADAACVFDGHLLCLHHGGTVEAWNLKTGTYAKDTSTQFSRKELTFLAPNGEKLWEADGSAVYRWSRKARGSEEAPQFKTRKQSVAALCPGERHPPLW